MNERAVPMAEEEKEADCTGEGSADGQAKIQAEGTEATVPGQASEPTKEKDDWRLPYSPEEYAELQAAYPNAEMTQDMSDPVFRGLVCGEIKPTLRQVYELFHREQLTGEAVETAVAAAVSDALAREIPAAVETAVAEAVAQAEEHLLDDIRLRGVRPVENGVATPGVVASHPSVDRLTRSERAQLARRAEHGERIRL